MVRHEWSCRAHCSTGWRWPAGIMVPITRPSLECVMTTRAANPPTPTSHSPGRFRLPDIPRREPDEVTQFNQLTRTGHAHHLIQHLGNPETTLVGADRWIIAEPGTFRDLARYPDLLIAFNVDPELYEASNGYIISEQGKPPDFVLEVASRSTGDTDTGAKREDYARLLIPEYWRFDETGEYHGARLAGDRLAGNVYEPIPLDELADDVLQGYSPVLNLLLRWERGELAFYDPATERHIVTYADLKVRAETAEVRAETAEVRAETAEANLQAERAARMRAEARVRQLEDRLSQQDD